MNDDTFLPTPIQRMAVAMVDLQADNDKFKIMLGRALAALDKIDSVDGLRRLSSTEQDIVAYLRQDIAIAIANPEPAP